MELRTPSSREVSETAFELLLGEVLHLQVDPAISAEETLRKYEEMGCGLGWRLSERLAMKHVFQSVDAIEKVKFICKEFWEFLFAKKIGT